MSEAKTLVHRIEAWAKDRPNAPALHAKQGDGFETWTWADYWRDVRAVAKGFIALGHEVGDAIAIVGANKPQWVILEFGMQAARGVPAPIYPTNTPEQMGYIIGNSRAKMGCCDGPELLKKYQDSEAGGHSERFNKIITFQKLETDDDRVVSFDELLALGNEQTDDELDKRLEELTDDETCLLIYTSGTTGLPKGVILDHGGQVLVGEGLLEKMPSFECEGGYTAVSYLPLSHQAEQLVTNVGSIMLGGQVYFCPDIKDIKEYLVAARPTIFLGVPRVWEKFEAALQAKLADATGIKAKLASWARRTELASFRKDALRGSEQVSLSRKIARKLVISKVKGALGLDRLRMAVTGAAPIAVSTQEFFASVGIVLYEGYGMTETSGVSTLVPFGQPLFGSVGKALKGVKIRIADDGEVQLHGRAMTKGYLHLPEQTEELYTDDGWLCTGDLGSLEDGHLRITGRKKELLITAGGKNVGPVEMENHIKGIDGVGQVMVGGDRKPYLCALVVLDA